MPAKGKGMPGLDRSGNGLREGSGRSADAAENKTPKGQAAGEGFLAEALAAHRAGNLDLAVAGYEAALRAQHEGEGGETRVLHLLGLALLQQGEAGQAVRALSRASELTPDDPAVLTGLGAAMHALGKLKEAARSYARAARLSPRDAGALFNLGNVLNDLGRSSAAASCYARALEADPGFAPALLNLGAIRQDEGRLSEAESLYRRALAASSGSPDSPEVMDALADLGGVLLDLGRPEEALAILSRLRELSPEDAESHYLEGLALADAGRPEEAARAFERAVAIDPEHAEAVYNLAGVMQDLGRVEDARALYRRTLALAPEDERASYFLAVLDGRTPEAMPRSMVEDLFDDYAGKFDDHLQSTLGYHMPRLFREVFDGAVPSQAPASLDILDLGCGTGLCGEQFRDLARRLVGVDLSERMLDQARHRGLYDELRREDLRETLARSEGLYDLVLAADVLTYVGDLDQVFAACGRALRGPGAMFLLCVESLGAPPGIVTQGGQEPPSFSVAASGRFAHSPDYVLGLAEAHGFTALAFRREHLRRHGSGVIQGDIHLLALSSR